MTCLHFSIAFFDVRTWQFWRWIWLYEWYRTRLYHFWALCRCWIVCCVPHTHYPYPTHMNLVGPDSIWVSKLFQEIFFQARIFLLSAKGSKRFSTASYFSGSKLAPKLNKPWRFCFPTSIGTISSKESTMHLRVPVMSKTKFRISK